MPRRRSFDGRTTRSRRGREVHPVHDRGLLGRTIVERDGPLDEALEMCDRSRELASDGDIATQALWRSVRGRILARTGALVEAEGLVREALAILEPTDAPVLRSEAYVDLGEVLVAAGRIEEARAAYEAARALAEEKGGVVTLGAVIRRIEGLDTAPV